MNSEKFSNTNPPPIGPEEINLTFLGRGLVSGKRMFSSLSNPHFRFYYTSVICQSTAINMQIIARSMLIYRITGSATILGLMSLTYALPVFILSYYGGFLADRYSKRKVMQLGYIIGALIAILIGIAIRVGYLSETRQDSWWLLMLASAIQGIILALTVPAQQSVLAELIPSKQIQNAVALNSMAMNGTRMLGPAVAGFMIEFAGFDSVFFTTGGIYLFGCLMIWFLPVVKRSTGEIQSALHGLKEGFSYLRHDVTIMLILSAALLVFVLGMPYFDMLPIFADDILQVGASGMGLLLTVNGAGAIVGSLIVAWRPPKNRGKILLTTIFLIGLEIVTFSFSKIWGLSLVLMAVIGITMAFFSTAANSLLLNYTEQEYRGRIMSIFIMRMGLASVGAAIAGAIADHIGGVQWAIGSMALILAAISLIAFFTLKRIRVLD